MTRRLEVTRVLPAGPTRVADAFWDIEAWQRVWDPISEVTVGYCDGRSQEFTMRVERDGRIEEVRTVRWRADGRIDFFSPTAPPMMTWHRGAWVFSPDPGGCAVTAVREYDLVPEDGYGDGAGAGAGAGEAARADRFHDGFTARVAAILDCFAAAFAHPAPAGTAVPAGSTAGEGSAPAAGGGSAAAAAGV